MKDVGLYRTTAKPKRAARKGGGQIVGNVMNDLPSGDIFRSGFDPAKLARRIIDKADLLQSNGATRATKTNITATNAAREARGCAVMAMDELRSAQSDVGAAFRCGWHLRQGLDLLAGWQASAGKRMNSAAANRQAASKFKKDGKKSKDGALDVNLRLAFDEWLRERRGEKTASAFMRWIEKECSAYSITMIDKQTFKSGDQTMKFDTIRKRIGKLLKT